jgi:hypothetical protein
MKKAFVLMTLLVLPILLSGSADATLMAIWDFGPNKAGYTEFVTTENVDGTPMLTLDGGEIDPDGKDGIEYTDSEGTFHSEGQAAAWIDLKVSSTDAEWTMMINTTGFEDMTIRWDYKAWNSDTDSFDLDYRVDGGLWQELLNNEPITGDETYHSVSLDMSGISAIEDQPVVEFRFYDLDRNGNDEYAFDNLELSGSVIPEPCTIALLALAGIKVLRKRERKN